MHLILFYNISKHCGGCGSPFHYQFFLAYLSYSDLWTCSCTTGKDNNKKNKQYHRIIPGIPAFSKTVRASCLPMEAKEPFNWSRVNSGSNIGIYFNSIKDELCRWWEPKFFNTRCGTFSCSARCFQLRVFFLSSFSAILPSMSVSSRSTRLATTLSLLITPPNEYKKQVCNGWNCPIHNTETALQINRWFEQMADPLSWLFDWHLFGWLYHGSTHYLITNWLTDWLTSIWIKQNCSLVNTQC